MVTAREVTEPFRSLEQAQNCGPEVVGLEGLGDERVCAALVGPPPRLLFCMSCEHHYRDALRGVVPTNPVEHFPSVHSREANVEHNEVGRLGADGVQAALAVVSGDDLQVADLPGVGRVGGLICWENRMPLARWRVYEGGPQIWLAPTADDSDGWLASMRHIAIEEKLLMPAAHEVAGQPLAAAQRLRLDHGAIAALLVPSPTTAIIATLQAILGGHNAVEEGPGGVYASCDRLLGERAAALVARMEAYPEPPVSPHNDDPKVMPVVQRALARAGHHLLP